MLPGVPERFQKLFWTTHDQWWTKISNYLSPFGLWDPLVPTFLDVLVVFWNCLFVCWWLTSSGGGGSVLQGMNWQGANKGLSVQLQPPPRSLTTRVRREKKIRGGEENREVRTKWQLILSGLMLSWKLDTFQRELFGWKCVDEDVNRFPYSPLGDAWTGSTNGIWASWW